MSIAALNWAFDQPIKPSGAKFVLVALCDYANEELEAYPSVSRLCEKTSQDRKSVMNNLSRLSKLGVITDTGMRRGKTMQVVVWKIIQKDIISSTESGTLKDALTVPKTEQLNSTKNGTVPKTEQYRFSHETVPFFPENEGKEYQKRYTEPSVLNHQEEPSVLNTPAQPEKKISKTKAARLLIPENLPAGLSAETLQEFIQHRKNKKAPLTQDALDRTIKSSVDVAAKLATTPDAVITETIDAGWQNFKLDWLRNRFAKQDNQSKSGKPSRHSGFKERDYHNHNFNTECTW